MSRRPRGLGSRVGARTRDRPGHAREQIRQSRQRAKQPGEEAEKLVRDFAGKNGINYPCAVIDNEFLKQVPGFRGFPTLLFLDREGRVAPRDQVDRRGVALQHEVERELSLGIVWQVETRVARLTPAGKALFLEVPLLAGESVTSADVRVVDGRAQVSFAPDASSSSHMFRSTTTSAPHSTPCTPSSPVCGAA